MIPQLRPLLADPRATAVLLDFDGTLSEIAPRPEDARPVAGAREAVAALTGRFGLVAVVSGRPTADVAGRLDVPGVRYLGLYGLEEPPPVPEPVIVEASAVGAAIDGARVETKGGSVSIHYRGAPDPVAARAAVLEGARQIAAPAGLEIIEGKMVVELVPRGRPRKGGAVERLVREAGARAAMYAGDDLADLEAFEALRRLRDEGVQTVAIAVRGPETPMELVGAADVTVAGPPGLVAALEELASAAG